MQLEVAMSVKIDTADYSIIIVVTLMVSEWECEK